MAQFGTWFTHTLPKWKQALDNCSDYELEDLEINREKIEEILEKLEELNIVH